jgi:hypothetical protein
MPFVVHRGAGDPDPAGVVRPVRPGASIVNPGGGVRGTIGLLVTSDGADRWILSCYHVLCRPYLHGAAQPLVMGERVFQPEGVGGAQPIATLRAGEVRSLSDRRLDAAVVRLEAGLGFSEVPLGVHGLTKIGGVMEPVRGMRVIKSGAKTGVTHGIISLVQTVDGATRVEIDFDWDEADDRFVESGDSGAAWIDRSTGCAVAMHNGVTNAGASAAVALKPVLAMLGVEIPQVGG